MVSTDRKERRKTVPEGIPGVNVGGRFAESYAILRVLGEGGMGTVYLARDVRSENRQVALKVLHPRHKRPGSTLSRGGWQSAEARLLASCEHPSILPVYDAGVDGATELPYFTMRPCLLTREELTRLCDEKFDCPYPRRRTRWDEGPCALTLRDLLEGGKALPESTVARIGIDLVGALAYTHGRTPPIVHRDIKPSNVLFDASGRAILSDFGIARDLLADEAGTVSAAQGTRGGHTFAGTPLYASPEQRQGDSVGPASDFYSLGVVLHEALTGQRPGGFASPSAYDPANISRQWNDLLPRLLADDPRVRLADPDEILHSLCAIIRNSSSRLPRILVVGLLCGAVGAGVLAVLHGRRHVTTVPKPPPVISFNNTVSLRELLSVTATNPVFVPFVPSEVVQVAARTEEVVHKVEALKKAPSLPPPSTNYFPAILIPPRPENNRRHSGGQIFEMRLPGGTPLQFVPVTFGPNVDDRLDEYCHGDFEKSDGERYRMETALDDRYVAVSKRLMVSRTEITRVQFDDVLAATNPVPLWEMRGSDWTNAPVLMDRLGMGPVEYGNRLPLLFKQARDEGRDPADVCYRTVFTRRPFTLSPPPGMPAAEGIRFSDVEGFIAKLNSLCPMGCVFRLPTEAEWESICRCRLFKRFEGRSPSTVCWSRENSGGGPHPVAEKTPNDFGAYDMHGNVAEWCLDGFQPMARPALDPVLPVPSNGWHVVRGGSWADPASECDSDSRRGAGPDATGIGFRLVLEY